MQKITSKDNEIIKHIKKLKDKKHRDASNEYMIEGIKLVAEAIQENCVIKYIILCDDCEKNEIIGNSIPMFCTEDLESIICTESTDDTVDDNNNTSNEKTFIKLADFDIECK